MVGLIVNADDLGLSEKVNQGIALAHTNGIVTSASVIACGAAFDHAVEVARSCPQLDTGIHLTLVEERPLLQPAEIPTLVDEQGRFLKSAAAFVKRYAQGKIEQDDIRKEFRAQIERARETGFQLSHIDSHQHLHMLPQVLAVVLELSKQYGIPALRYPSDAIPLSGGFRQYRNRRLLETLLLKNLCRMQKKRIACYVSDFFVGFGIGGRISSPWLRALAGRLPQSGVCELMCHPGQDDPGSRYAHWGYHWQEELEALTDPGIVGLFKQRSHLTSYREIAGQPYKQLER